MTDDSRSVLRSREGVWSSGLLWGARPGQFTVCLLKAWAMSTRWHRVQAPRIRRGCDHGQREASPMQRDPLPLPARRAASAVSAKAAYWSDADIAGVLLAHVQQSFIDW